MPNVAGGAELGVTAGAGRADLGLEAALASKLLSVPQATLRDIGLKEG